MVAIPDIRGTADRASKRLAIWLWLGVFTFAAVVVITSFPRVDITCKNVMVSNLMPMMGGGIVSELHYQLVVGKVKVPLPPDWTSWLPPELTMFVIEDGRCV